ncbi:aminopeptidase P family protein [Massilimicrobiota timonensis]|uniref:Peptidase M24 n=1 Tax=Massilimicrobiota timonensis TaxID=1776392 RepID=A0A1Y4SV40_9FIRM|nr:aminopeptidase P family protein [Massilimicrobiota timonensis]OUQ32851.1 peptidase M24 [Massilimicrobiota timonensis]
MIKDFQQLLKDKNIQFYIVPTDDDHQSETVGDYYQARAYLSGFTGSAGTLLVMQDEAYLWTDGRYFIQAAKELYEGITLMKSGQKGVPTLLEFLKDHVQKQDTIAFDGQTMTCQFVLDMEKEIQVPYHIECIDLMEDYWKDRPQRSCEKAFLYDIQYHGLSTHQKIEKIVDVMKEHHCDAHIMTTLDDIAWTFNIRGNDIPCSPTVLAFALITLDQSYLYLQKGSYDLEMVKAFQKENVIIKEYLDIYQDARQLKGRVLLSQAHINYALYQCLDCEIVNQMNPSQMMKAIKNDVEIENSKNAHIKDGVAMTKFMYWLKKNYGKIPMDEMSISHQVLQFRQQQDLFIEPSFTTICAWKDNAALMHYHPTENQYTTLDQDGMLLIDSGGQYMDGTTDITRTFVLGHITDMQKKHFTMVLQGMLTLQNAHFLYGCTGQSLDILARSPMWSEDIDYQCGTGHGVGHLLNVHEGPQGFRYKLRSLSENITLEPGMNITDEPGIYLEGQYGIRIENELLCVKGTENEYGQFLHFEPLTFVPIDLDAVEVSLLSPKEKNWLNQYHQEVYEKISPYLTDKEKDWLKEYTRAI